MNINYKVLRRPAAALSALALVVGTAAPALLGGQVYAAQLLDRAVKISDSTPGATNVQYQLTFKTDASAGTTQELIVDFCGDSPLIGSTCAFSAATVPTISSPTVDTGSVATVGSGTPIHTVAVTGLTLAANTTYTITFTGGFTNPTAVGSFYARVLTYTTGNAATYAPANSTGDPTTVGSAVDFGGAALSTVQQITVTAKVMETLSFCASGIPLDGTYDLDGAGAGTAMGEDCADATAPALEIGHGTPKILESGTVDAATAYTQLSTNASSGAIIRMKATNACANAGLSTDGGTNCNIAGIAGGGNGSVPAAFTLGTANFGLFVSDSRVTTGVASSTGTILPNANYNDSTNENEAAPATLTYGMDRQSGAGTDGVLTVYGDTIAASTAPVSQINNNLVFGATPSLTTPAGIYTGNEILIATGTF